MTWQGKFGFGEEEDPEETRTVPSLPYQPHRDTSKKAAENHREAGVSQRQRVMRYFAEHGPATDDEMLSALGLPAHSGTARRWELELDGRVYATEVRRDTRSGHSAIVWAATPENEVAARRDAARKASAVRVMKRLLGAISMAYQMEYTKDQVRDLLTTAWKEHPRHKVR